MHDFQIAKILSDLSISGIKENLHKTVKPNSIMLVGSKLVRSQIPLRYLVWTGSEPASKPAPNQLA